MCVIGVKHLHIGAPSKYCMKSQLFNMDNSSFEGFQRCPNCSCCWHEVCSFSVCLSTMDMEMSDCGV